MSPDEVLLERVIATLRKVKLEAILVGNVASVLQGVPIMTQDIDLFVRDTELNRKKIRLFAEELGLSIFKRDEAISEVITAEGHELVVDFIFRLSHDQKFESVRSRAKRVKIGRHYCLVADLEDILKAKKAANRPKDQAALKLIEDTLRIRNYLQRKSK
jgi:predicted nucleotidyltransferase